MSFLIFERSGYKLSFSMILRMCILILFLVKLSSCTVSTTRLNDKEDQSDAQKITTEFYNQMRVDQYEKTLSFYSDTFKMKIDTNQLFSFYRHYKNKTGAIKNTEVLKCESKAITTGGIKTKYFAVDYQVERAIKSTKESFVLKAFGNELPKIYRYDIFEIGAVQ